MTNGIVIGTLIGDDQETPGRVIMGVLNTLQIHAALMELTSKPSRKPRHIKPQKESRYQRISKGKENYQPHQSKADYSLCAPTEIAMR